MTRGESRKRHQSSRKSTDENDHSQTGEGEEFATPPARCTSPRRGRLEELTEMNPSKPLQTEPEIGNDYYYAASAVSPNTHHQDRKIICSPLTTLPNHYLILHKHWKINILRRQKANKPFLDCLTCAKQ